MTGDGHTPSAGPTSPLGLAIVATVVIVDQLTKLIADALIPVGERIDLLPVLSLLRVNNTGIALSFLSDSGAPLILLMLVVTIIVLIMWYRARSDGRIASTGFALIVGGAVGNLIDRVRLGHVVDFLLLRLGDYPLFVFNMADVALTGGPALLLLLYLWPSGRRDIGD